jgi:hypothetical protein
MAGRLIDQIIEWLAKAILATLKALWGLLEQTVFTNPDVTVLPQVVTISSRSQMIVNAAFVLAIIAIGVTVMTHETVQVRYGVGDLIPRLVVGFIAANFATPICSKLIETANALTGALTGDGIDAEGSFGHMQRVVEGALSNGTAAFLLVVLGLIIAVLTGMLLVTYLVRVGVLVVLVGIAPVALACHATPFTEGAAKLWWRSMLGVLATVVLQALAMHTALSVFLDPNANANVGSLGIPNDQANVGNLFIVACLLWVVVKIPGMMGRYVTSGQHSNAGMFLRMMLIQAVSQVVRRPGRRGGRAAASGAGGRRAATRGTAGGPSVANTVIPYWRPRMPRPTPGGTRTSTSATSSTTLNRGRSPAGGTSTTARPATRGGASASARPSAGASSSPPPRSTRPPIRAAGVTPTPPPAGPRPVIPLGVNPATAMPRSRPVRPPVSGPWNRPPRPRRSP